MGCDVSEFGHHGIIGAGFCIDCWGAGPFIIEVDGKEYRFEDSDRFGPSLLNKDDSIKARQPGERNPFWMAHLAWVRQGRRLDADGVHCVWVPLKPTKFERVGQKNIIVEHGDADGPFVEVRA